MAQAPRLCAIFVCGRDVFRTAGFVPSASAPRTTRESADRRTRRYEGIRTMGGRRGDLDGLKSGEGLTALRFKPSQSCN